MSQLDRRLVADGFAHREDAACGELFVSREEFRPYLDGDVQMITPAGEFLQTVGLALRGTLRQRQATRLGENSAEVDRIDAHLRVASHCHGLDPGGAEVRPGRVERDVVVYV